MSFGTKYKELANYIEDIFKLYMNNPIYTIKLTVNYRLKTKTLPILIMILKCFIYITIKKISTLNSSPKHYRIHEIQGDGNDDKNRKRVQIYTNSFTKGYKNLIKHRNWSFTR